MISGFTCTVSHARLQTRNPLRTIARGTTKRASRARFHGVRKNRWPASKLVMKGRRLEGVVTTTDITNAVADGKLTAHTFVFDRPLPRGGRERWGRRQ